jgi:hypothetical protein
MTRAMAVSVAAASLLAPGCGGDDGGDSAKERYEREFNATVERFEGLPRIAPADDAPVAEQITALNAARARIIDFANELHRIEPPADVAGAHRAYVDAIRRFAVGEMDEIMRALRRGGESAANEVLGPEPEDQPAIERLRDARREFDEKGYDLGDVSEVPQ